MNDKVMREIIDSLAEEALRTHPDLRKAIIERAVANMGIPRPALEAVDAAMGCVLCNEVVPIRDFHKCAGRSPNG